MDLRDGQDGGLQRIDVAADDGLQRLTDRHRDDNRILGTLRHGAMRAVAGDDDVEEVRAGHRGAGQDRDFAVVEIGRVVQSIQFITGEFVEQLVLDHGARAAETFLGRLEDEMHGAVEVFGFRQIARGTQKHGGVAVMTAAVEAAGNGGAPAQVGVFLHRQRVHVGAQPDAFGA